MMVIIGPCAMAQKKSETPHLAFVTEYVRELDETEAIREQGEKEAKGGKPEEVFTNSIHNSTLVQLELRSQIRVLKSMRLNAPFETLLSLIIRFYEEKISLHDQMIALSTAFMSGPAPGVDYGALAAKMPKIRAELEYADRSLFESTPLIFATLIDTKADSKNHASHLVITKAERAELLSKLASGFGAKLDLKDQPFVVSTAIVLRGFLLKDFKCSDEPWE
jgi:hypothetical protein